jgi:predicted membrane channel-forming protein YqfA (hemolysin III family)
VIVVGLLKRLAMSSASALTIEDAPRSGEIVALPSCVSDSDDSPLVSSDGISDSGSAVVLHPEIQTIPEEVANSITHGIGAALSVAALVMLVVHPGDAWRATSFSVYGTSLVFAFVISTLYHSIQHKKTKDILQRVDHSAIYILIAGTYTAVTLVSMRQSVWGWALFVLVW